MSVDIYLFRSNSIESLKETTAWYIMNAQARTYFMLIMEKLLSLDTEYDDTKKASEWWVSLDTLLESYYKANKAQ